MIQKAKIWNNNVDQKQMAKHLYRKYNIATLSNQGPTGNITTRLYLNDM